VSVASTTIAQGAYSDPRILYLAQLAGYVDGVDAALGKLARLWGRCTHLQTDVVSPIEVRACLGPRGDEHLVAAGLGELVPAGVRVKGRLDNTTGRDRFAWYAETPAKKDGRAAGGKARAAGAERGPGGKFAGTSKSQQINQQTSNAEPAADLLEFAGSSNRQQPGQLDQRHGQQTQHSQLQEQDQDQTLSLGSGSSPSGLSDPPNHARADLGAPSPDEPPPGMALEMPRGWTPAPEPELEREAADLGLDVAAELRKLRDRGERRVDWQARWRTWLGHAIAFARKQAKPAPAPSPDRASRAAAERRAEIERDRAENARLAAAAARDRADVAQLAAAAQTKLRGAG